MLDKLDCFMRFNWAIFGKMTFLFANETYDFPFVRKISGGGLSLSEKSEFFRTQFPGWKWESRFLKMRLFLWCTITLFWIFAFDSQVRLFASRSERFFVFDKFLKEFHQDILEQSGIISPMIMCQC